MASPYLTSRYAPELEDTAAEVNQMAAALNEVARKTAVMLAGPAAPAA